MCHAPGSAPNPYVEITVDVSSVVKHGHDGHEGPVFSPDLPKHTKWGDIIPAFSVDKGSYPGMNMTAQGRAILENGCDVPGDQRALVVCRGLA